MREEIQEVGNTKATKYKGILKKIKEVCGSET